MSKDTPLPPGSTIGILGSGQLGRMLAVAASRLGFKAHVYCDTSGPAFDVAAIRTTGNFDDVEALKAFARTCDAVTYEFENVPVAAVLAVGEAGVAVQPGRLALEVAQDRLNEKRFISALGVPVAPFAPVEKGNLADAERALAGWRGAGAILKTRRLGYDGKGQVPVMAADDLAAAHADLGHVPCVLEQRLSFACEVSVLVVRGKDGRVVIYDVPENEHAGGILRRSRVPSRLSPAETAAACRLAERVAEALGYVGLLAVELFYMGPAAPEPFLVNEIAPRVHNSGHWTMDACAVSQFENHIRAVAGWPLGATDRHSDAIMENLIGEDVLQWRALAGDPGAILHVYGKREARAGRKMGHVNRLSRRRD